MLRYVAEILARQTRAATLAQARSDEVVLLGDTDWVCWSGDFKQYEELIVVLGHHRTCAKVDCRDLAPLSIVPDCSAHDMLNHQRVMDGLLFGRSQVARWRREEWA